MFRKILVAITATIALGAASTAIAQNKKPPKKEAPAPDKKAPDKAPPAAPSAADMEKAKQAYIKGSELFEKKDFDGAVKEFKLSYRLSRNPILLYNIGYTLDQAGNKPRALFYYDKFLADGPNDHPNYPIAKKRRAKLARELKADAVFNKPKDPKPKGGNNKKPANKAKVATAPKRAAVTDLMHKVVDEAPPGKPLDLTCFVPEDSQWTVTLYFRGARESKFTATQMKPRYNELVGRVPHTKMQGSSIQYYIEARDKGGKLVTRSGRSTSPHLVLIDAQAKPRYYPDLTNDRSWEGAYTGGTEPPNTRPPTGTGGGWMDIESKRFTYAKWGATGTAIGLVGLSIAFYVSASSAASTLEAEALKSNMDTSICTNNEDPPCVAFGQYQKDLEAHGKRMQTFSRLSFTFGLVAAGGAAYLWWKEIEDKKKRTRAAAPGKSRTRLVTVPMIDRNSVGGAALLRF